MIRDALRAGCAVVETLRVDTDGTRREESAGVAIEEPLEIRVCGDTLGVTLRTPGHDVELAAGLLFAEGVIDGVGDLGTVTHCNRGDEDSRGNVIDVTPAAGVSLSIDDDQRRSSLTTSACGVCGRRSIESLLEARGVVESELCFPREAILRLSSDLRDWQTVFRSTGGVHAAAAATPAGFAVVREDVGRHNAVDKVIGRLLLDGLLPASSLALFVSGRASFEIVHKACCAKLPLVVAVSAPSSLAVGTAERLGVTLVGFSRQDGFRVYTHAERIG